MSIKRCTKCRKRKMLNADNFYRDRGNEDGYRYECKDCSKEREKEDRISNPAKYRIIDREKNSKKTVEQHRISSQRHRDRYPDRNRANQMVYYYTSNGKLARLACEKCGNLLKPEAHHEDYSKPLEIIWLCRKHHIEADIKLGFRYNRS